MLANLHLNGTGEAHSLEQTARTIFRESIAQVAEGVKATLPNSHGRIEKAIAIVLQDDVLPFEDGRDSLWVLRAIRICITSWTMNARVPIRIEHRMAIVNTSSPHGCMDVERLWQPSVCD